MHAHGFLLNEINNELIIYRVLTYGRTSCGIGIYGYRYYNLSTYVTRRIAAPSIENSKICMSLYPYLKVILFFLPYIILFIIINYVLLLIKTIQQ